MTLGVLIALVVIDSLPLVAEKLPKPDEVRTISIGNGADGQGLASLVAQVMSVLDTFRANNARPVKTKD